MIHELVYGAGAAGTDFISAMLVKLNYVICLVVGVFKSYIFGVDLISKRLFGVWPKTHYSEPATQ